MRTSRCILYTALGTGLCLLYVFIQTEIVKLGYRITSAEKILEVHLDRKTALEYHLSMLESPVSLDKNILFKNEGFEMAKDYKLVKLSPQVSSGKARGAVVASAGKEKRFAWSSLFASRQAEAKTVR